MDPAATLGIAIGVVALALSLLTFWRTELRGPRTRCLPVLGSTKVNIGQASDEASPRLLVNVWRDLLFINDGHRPAYISLIQCELPNLPGDLSVLRADVGVTKELVPEPFHRLEAFVDRDEPSRVTVSWWLALALEDEEKIRALIRDPSGALSMVVRWTALESVVVWPRFKVRQITIRPKSLPAELVGWSDAPYGL